MTSSIFARTARHRGIIIGPILMALAIIALIVAAFAYGTRESTVNISVDRTAQDLHSQADMIRAKLGECLYLTRQPIPESYLTDPDYMNKPTSEMPDYPQYQYPNDPSSDAAIAMKDLFCPRDPTGKQNLWSGARPVTLPPPPPHFETWYYVNHGDPKVLNPGGTCIRIKPDADSASNASIRAGIAQALRFFSPNEVTYDPNSADQQIIIWLRHPRSGNAC